MKTRRMMLLVALTALAGCARATSAGNSNVATINRNFCPKSTATIYVTNDNWLDLVIYAVRGNTRYRLGEVTGIQSAVFTLPDAIINGSTFGVFADPVGSFGTQPGRDHGFYTGEIPIQPGHTVVDLRVANIINQSSFSYGVELPADIS